MALFKKGSRGEAQQSPAEPPQDAPGKQAKRRRPQESLASVVNESAPGAAVDLMSRNEPFALPNRAGWAILLLNTGSPEFGGLSLKQRGDEAKGSIIELIAGDQIQVVATARMLDMDVLGIIPNEATLRRLGEYRILRDAKYAWGIISEGDDGLVENAVAEATFASAQTIAAGQRTLQQELPDVWQWALGDEAPQVAPPPPPVPEAAPQAEPAAFDDASEDPFGQEGAPSESAVEPEPVAAPVYEEPDDGVDYATLDEGDAVADLWADDETPVYDDDEAGDEQDLDDYDDGGEDEGPTYEQYLEAHEGREVTEREVRESIIRRFADAELDLAIDAEEFEKTFSTDVPAVTIDVGDSDDWLSGQVALIASQANAQLAQLHEDNRAELRQQYVDLMSIHAEKVARDLSLNTEGARYTALLKAAESDYDSDKARASEETARLRKEIVDRFDSEAEDVAQAAAAEARSRFHRQNRPTKERLLSEAGVDVDRRGDERFAENRRTLIETRRKDAGYLMEMGVTRALQILAERQAEQRQAEAVLLHEWTDRIMAFIDENRKNDVARTEALAEQLARQNTVADLTEQFAKERASLQAEQEAKVASLQAEMLHQREASLAELKQRDEAWQHKVADAEGRVNHANDLVQALTDQLGSVGERIEEQYTARIADLEGDKRSFSEELERAGQIQKRANTTMLILLIALTLAGVLVGVILGWVFAHQGDSSTVAAATVVSPWVEGWWPTA